MAAVRKRNEAVSLFTVSEYLVERQMPCNRYLVVLPPALEKFRALASEVVRRFEWRHAVQHNWVLATCSSTHVRTRSLPARSLLLAAESVADRFGPPRG